MSQPALAEDVRYERVSTPRELEAGLRALPDGVRFGITRELNDRGQVLRLDGQSQRVHYLRWDGDDIVIVTWEPMSRGVSVMLRNAPGLVERLLRGRARLPASAPSAAYEQVAATPLKAG